MGLTKNPIVVLGMFRSGTSSVALALSKLGVFWGKDSDFFPPDENNQAGYFEDREMVQRNHKILAAYRMAFNAVRPLPVAWRELPQTELIIPNLMEEIEAKYANRAIWGFKQPMAGPLIAIYQEAFRRLGLEPQYVLCVRNPMEVAASEAKWNYDERARFHAPLGELAYGLWLQYTLMPLSECSPTSLTVVSFADFLEDPTPFLHRIVSKGHSWAPTGDQWNESKASLQKRLRRSATDEKQGDELPTIVRRAFALCTLASREPSALDNGALKEEIDYVWAEACSLRRMFREADPPAGGLVAIFPDGSHTDENACRFLPEPGWQTVRLKVPAHGNSPVFLSLYSLPAVVWIRRAVWHSESRELPANLEPGPHGAKGAFGAFTNLLVVPEPQQIMARTPDGQGPFEIEIEFHLETGFYVAVSAINGMLKRMMPNVKW